MFGLCFTVVGIILYIVAHFEIGVQITGLVSGVFAIMMMCALDVCTGANQD